jgi:hypothetical protein
MYVTREETPMHKRLMKLIVGVTLGIVVGLVVAGTASARMVFPASEHAKISSYKSSLLGYPRGVVGAPGLGTADSTPLTSLLGYPRGVVGAPGLETAQSTPPPQHAQKVKLVSSFDDFPEVTRTMSLTNATHSTSNGFDWNDAGIGVAIAAGALSIVALIGVGIRRSRVTPATA